MIDVGTMIACGIIGYQAAHARRWWERRRLLRAYERAQAEHGPPRSIILPSGAKFVRVDDVQPSGCATETDGDD